MSSATTTIKVSKALRDRINRDALARGLTAAGLIERLLDDAEREQMLEAFGRAFATPDPGYQAESAVWEAIEPDWPRD